VKNTKILIVLVLTLTIFIGCAHTTGNVSKASASPVLDRILQRGELIVGTAGGMPPLNMTTKEGEVIGFEPDLARIMAGAMGVKLKIQTMPFSELLPSMEAEGIDMIMSGMTMTPQRNLKVAFVGPYFISGKGFLTTIKTIANANSTSAINRPGTRLVTLEGSTSQRFVEMMAPKATLLTAKDYDDAVDMVINDRAHAMVADHPICIVSVLRYPEKKLLTMISPLTHEPIGIALPANDPHLVNWLENLLSSLKGSGQMDDLKKRWFEDASWIKKLP
jgi:polar amino acid transport system substrate-binding protein